MVSWGHSPPRCLNHHTINWITPMMDICAMRELLETPFKVNRRVSKLPKQRGRVFLKVTIALWPGAVEPNFHTHFTDPQLSLEGQGRRLIPSPWPESLFTDSVGS